MPVVKKTTSPLGLYIKDKVLAFLNENSESAKKAKSSTPEEGIEAISEAIVYAACLAWSSSIIQSAFGLGAVPPVVPPSATTVGNSLFGSAIHGSILTQSKEIP